jgi:hypothetical protein
MTKYGRETEAFLAQYKGSLEATGIPMDGWACEQVEMRLGYARRLTRRLRVVRADLEELGVRWSGWMGRVMLYYYYPEKLSHAPSWVKQLAEVLVACEQFEAFSNRERGRDYYVRTRENLADAFHYLESLQQEGIVSEAVLRALRDLTAEGAFDAVLREARGRSLTREERLLLRRMREGGTGCR